MTVWIDRRADDNVHVGASLCLFIRFFLSLASVHQSLLFFFFLNVYTDGNVLMLFEMCSVFLLTLDVKNHLRELPYLHAGLCQFCRCLLHIKPIIH